MSEEAPDAEFVREFKALYDDRQPVVLERLEKIK